MRDCPFDGCNKTIPDDRFACPRHWFSLNKDQQDRIWSAYRAYLKDQIGIEALRATQNLVIAEAQR